MAKIIEVAQDLISIGMDDGSLKEVPVSAFKATPHKVAAHALLQSVFVMLHKNLLTGDSQPAIFLYNLTKNLASQSAHPDCAVLP